QQRVQQQLVVLGGPDDRRDQLQTGLPGGPQPPLTLDQPILAALDRTDNHRLQQAHPLDGGDHLAVPIGRPRSPVSNTLPLLHLTPPVPAPVAAGVLTARHAPALLGVPDAERQDQLARRIVAEGLS
ncbi:hypothetical protein UK12_33440, partial [Saccharothrix sp. ST-888]